MQVRGPNGGDISTYVLTHAPPVAVNTQGSGSAAAATASGSASTTSKSPNQSNSQPAFEDDFNKIQLAAARLVAIQEMAKRKGTFNSEDNKIYAESLAELGQAAQNLAKLQQTGQIKDFSVLFQPDVTMPQKQPLFPSNSMSNIDRNEALGEQKVEDGTEQQLSEDEYLPPHAEDPYEDVHDSVAVNAPKKDAAVAEAKPVGLSIAGEGGVASSKPNAVALSGRNGLAVSAPKATAIAGVTPEEAAAFSISLPNANRNQIILKAGSTPPQKQSTQARPVQHRLAYDDYDYAYGETVPMRPVHKLSPFSIDVTPYDLMPKLRQQQQYQQEQQQQQQQQQQQHAVSKTKNAPASSNPARDSLINKWKTAIAEGYAAAAAAAATAATETSATGMERNANPNLLQRLKTSNKIALASNDGHTFYIY